MLNGASALWLGNLYFFTDTKPQSHNFHTVSIYGWKPTGQNLRSTEKKKNSDTFYSVASPRNDVGFFDLFILEDFYHSMALLLP
jgi:hypothetical protein